MKKGRKSIRAIEIDFGVCIWKARITLSLSPFVWRKWMLAIGDECWSKGSTFHWFFGPLHVWSMRSDMNLLALEFDCSRNGFWWDKPVKKQRSLKSERNPNEE